MFYSVLFPIKEQHDRPRRQSEPEYFQDLHLNRIFDSILMREEAFGKKVQMDFGLKDVFYTPLQDPEVISYRQEVLRELEDDSLRTMFTAFANEIYAVSETLKEIRTLIATMEKEYDNYLTRGRFLHCVERYCNTISTFSSEIAKRSFRSAGLRRFAEYLEQYAASEEFNKMQNHYRRLRSKLSSVEFCVLIQNDTIRIRRYEGQADHARELLSLLARFTREESEKYSVRHIEEMPDIRMEAIILDMVAELYKDIFADFKKFCLQYKNFGDETIFRFCREIQFYLLWLNYIMPLRRRGLSFCYPKLCKSAEHLYCIDGFDLALAQRNINKPDIVVTNDFEMKSPEHIFVITGANQGGKTTFARAFGQLHYLAALGLCVPGRRAALYLCDNILTHFEREEELSELSGKLQDDLLRLHRLLGLATRQSIIIINEIFSSTTLRDALSLGKRMMEDLVELGAPAIVVTFLDDLARHGPETVSMMSIVKEDGSAERTFRIMRKPPDGLAYAIQLLKKHGLSYEQLSGRLAK